MALERETNTYWRMIERVDNDVKLALIARLSASMMHTAKRKKLSALDFAGVWNDADYMDADKMVEQMKHARRFKKREETL